MEKPELEAILEAFNGLDGATVVALGFETGTSMATRKAFLDLRAYREAKDNQEGGWEDLRIVAQGEAVLSWHEAPWDTNLVLNYPASLVEIPGRLILDLDPLHAQPNGHGSAELSRCFLGGSSLVIEVNGS
jgi:hypothetical protein